MTRRRRKLKTRPPRYLLGRWQTKGGGCSSKGQPESTVPLLSAWRQPGLTAGEEGTFRPRRLLGEPLAEASPPLPREWIRGRAFELLGSLGPGAWGRERAAAASVPRMAIPEIRAALEPRALGGHLGWRV